jgi:hypothetical protein
MALFRNFGVNRRNRLCGVHKYASAQFLDFLELAKNCSFLVRKLIGALNEIVDEHSLLNYSAHWSRLFIIQENTMGLRLYLNRHGIV